MESNLGIVDSEYPQFNSSMARSQIILLTLAVIVRSIFVISLACELSIGAKVRHHQVWLNNDIQLSLHDQM